jgi:hypothetical protein
VGTLERLVGGLETVLEWTNQRMVRYLKKYLPFLPIAFGLLVSQFLTGALEIIFPYGLFLRSIPA